MADELVRLGKDRNSLALDDRMGHCHRTWLAGFGNGDQTVASHFLGGLHRVMDAAQDAVLFFTRKSFRRP